MKLFPHFQVFVSRVIIITIKNWCVLPWATPKELRLFQSTLFHSDLAFPRHFSLFLLLTCSIDPFSPEYIQPTQSVLLLGTSQWTSFSPRFLLFFAILQGMESIRGYRNLWQPRRLRLHQIQHLWWLEKLKRNKVTPSGPTASFIISLHNQPQEPFILTPRT